MVIFGTGEKTNLIFERYRPSPSFRSDTTRLEKQSQIFLFFVAKPAELALYCEN
jgi:hypothetical protein